MSNNESKKRTEILDPLINKDIVDSGGAKDNRHRTLVEVVICGICAAIFLVLYVTEPPPRPPGGYNAVARADLNDASLAQETYWVDNETYTESIEKLIGPEYGLDPREGVTIRIISADKSHYLMEAFHEKGDFRYVIEGPGGISQELTK